MALIMSIRDVHTPFLEPIISFSVILSVTLNIRGLLRLPVIFPQTTVSIASIHIPSPVTSVQVTLVLLVVVGQLPQFEAWML